MRLLLSKHGIYCCKRCARTLCRGLSTCISTQRTTSNNTREPYFCTGKPVPFIGPFILSKKYRERQRVVRSTSTGIKMLVVARGEEAETAAFWSSCQHCVTNMAYNEWLGALVIRFARKHADLCSLVDQSSPLERAQNRRAAFDDDASTPTCYIVRPSPTIILPLEHITQPNITPLTPGFQSLNQSNFFFFFYLTSITVNK